MTQKSADLLLSFLESYGLAWVARNRPGLLRETLTFLHKEVYRLKSGEFTEEEFQNLCHGFSEADKCKFFQGCHEYQRKLFGISERDELKNSEKK